MNYLLDDAIAAQALFHWKHQPQNLQSVGIESARRESRAQVNRFLQYNMLAGISLAFRSLFARFLLNLKSVYLFIDMWMCIHVFG